MEHVDAESEPPTNLTRLNVSLFPDRNAKSVLCGVMGKTVSAFSSEFLPLNSGSNSSFKKCIMLVFGTVNQHYPFTISQRGVQYSAPRPPNHAETS